MAQIMSKYQNIQTKCPGMWHKKQLKAMCVSEKNIAYGQEWNALDKNKRNLVDILSNERL